MNKFYLAFVLAGSGLAGPVLHHFSLWGKAEDLEKIMIYTGWTNGFSDGGRRAKPLVVCLQNLTSEQVIAMIDKQYSEHPEKWNRSLSDQIEAALTVAGGPCQGKAAVRDDQ